MDQSIVDTFVGQASQHTDAESSNAAPQTATTPSSASPAGMQDKSCAWSESSARRPWLRLLARSFDILLFSVAAEFIASMIWPNLRTGNFLLIGLVPGVVLYLVTDALLMATFGATPGKYLLKVDVVPDTWRNMTLRQALYRSFMVGWRGLAFGLPILNFIAMYHARKRLLETGSTPWDERGHFYVFHREVGILGTFLLVSVSILVLLFGSILSYLMSDRRPTVPLDYGGVTASKQGIVGDRGVLTGITQAPGNGPKNDLIEPAGGLAEPDSQLPAAASGAAPVAAAPLPTGTDAPPAKLPGSKKEVTYAMPPVSQEVKLDPQTLAAQALAGVSGTAAPALGTARHQQATRASIPLAHRKAPTAPGSMLPEARALHHHVVRKPAKAGRRVHDLSVEAGQGASVGRAVKPVQSPASHDNNAQAGHPAGEAGQWAVPAANTEASAPDVRSDTAGQDNSAKNRAAMGQTGPGASMHATPPGTSTHATLPGASTHATPAVTAPASTPATAIAPASTAAQLPAAAGASDSSAAPVMDAVPVGAPSSVAAPAPATQAGLASGLGAGTSGKWTGQAAGGLPGQDFQAPETIPAAAPGTDNVGAPVIQLQGQQANREPARDLPAAQPSIASDPAMDVREGLGAPAAAAVTVPDRVSGSRIYTGGQQDGTPASGTGRTVPSSGQALAPITIPSAVTQQEAPVSVDATGAPADFQQTAVQQMLPGSDAGGSALRY